MKKLIGNFFKKVKDNDKVIGIVLSFMQVIILLWMLIYIFI